MKKRKETEHPRFDRCRFEILFDPKRDGEKVAYQVFTNQAQEILGVLAEATSRRKNKELSGVELREALEKARSTRFARSRQREIFRIFQDYRARMTRAGFLRPMEQE